MLDRKSLSSSITHIIHTDISPLTHSFQPPHPCSTPIRTPTHPRILHALITTGQFLARRLYGPGTSSGPDKPQLMVYSDIPTTVFTPLELGTVGLTEEQVGAIDPFPTSILTSSFSPSHHIPPPSPHLCLAGHPTVRRRRRGLLRERVPSVGVDSAGGPARRGLLHGQDRGAQGAREPGLGDAHRLPECRGDHSGRGQFLVDGWVLRDFESEDVKIRYRREEGGICVVI